MKLLVATVAPAGNVEKIAKQKVTSRIYKADRANRGQGNSGDSTMNKFIVSTAAVMLSLGTTGAFAQTETQSTTVQTSPENGTQTTTTTTESNDGYTQYRKTVTATRHYNAGAFEAPTGYTYSRYALGQHVPALLLESNNLMLSDYASYQLDAPPQGLKWIRVGDDALLVDRSTGEVVQADYNLFD
jgi:Ni/Co efflux regulator RcnB